MPFDLKAILESLARKLGPATEKLAVVRDPNGLGAVSLAREGYTIAHFGGVIEPRPAHVFADLADFAAYLNRHAVGFPKCDVLIDAHGATATFNHESRTAPKISCALRLHPDWSAWGAVLGKALTAEQLHDHVRAVAPTFTGIDNEGMAVISTGEHILAQLARLEVVKGGGIKIGVAANGLIEFSGSEDKTTVTGRFPDAFEIVTPLYDSVEDDRGKSDAYTVEVLLTLKVVDGAPLFVLRAPRKSVAELDALRGAVAYLRRLLHESFLVGVGEARSVDVSVGPVLD